jgi:hypothetical protein
MLVSLDKKGAVMKDKFLFSLILALTVLILAVNTVTAQTAAPTPAEESVSVGGYEVKSSVELGVRGREINGSENKFRSDFNYKSGFRVFDSSFLMEKKEGAGTLFDSLLITSSGWGADPTGYLRMNVEKIGAYRFDSNVREITYFNNLSNHALGEHTANTKHRFGDFDLTILPQNETLRFRLGTSFNKTTGDGGYTTRAYSDEFPVSSNVDTSSIDFRGGVDAKVLGFNLSFTQGYRRFNEDTTYFLTAPNLGNNPTNNSRLTTFQRDNPIDGKSNYSLFTIQRTFAKRLDFTGRFIYSDTNTNFSLNESLTGRDNSNNTVNLDSFDISGDAKRTQGRGDLGVTFRVTDNFRISDTVTYDQFRINGGNLFFESLARRNAAGTMLPTTITRTSAYRTTGYRRTTNLIEGDYQFNNVFGFNIGYRYTNRRVDLQLLDRNLISGVPTAAEEEFNNNTNAVIAGVKIKPIKNWTIYADVERGTADNVFTRLANYDYTNFRVRSRMNFDKFAVNASFITKNNQNPSGSSETLPTNFIADTSLRIFSASVDYNPVPELSISGGYTYHFQNSRTDILVPINSMYVPGESLYFMRDGYAFFDVSAQPFKRISVFASFRASTDDGQGSRISTAPQNIIGSYPYRLLSPEVRVAVHLTRNIDWNIGYQYYDYRDTFTPTQNYNAHLPYTSLRIYFGGGASDRR